MKSFVHTVFAAVLSLLIAAQALATEKVNINTADAAALDRVLVGVGPSKAAAIVEYRKANGPFKSAEELAMVKGIGLSTVEQNRDRIELRTGAQAGCRNRGARQAGRAALIDSRAGRLHRTWSARHRGRKPGGNRRDADRDVSISRTTRRSAAGCNLIRRR